MLLRHKDGMHFKAEFICEIDKLKIMKKICIVMILCLALIQVKAQNGVVFKVKYAPNRTYQTNVKVDAKFNVDLSGNQELIDKIKSQGITQPIAANLSISMSGITKTGSLAANKSFPVNLDYKIDDISASASGKQFPIPPKITEKDFKMAGRVTNGWQIALDSANGRYVRPYLKARFRTRERLQLTLPSVKAQKLA